MSKPILCVDFDGVIHSYEHGWQDGKIYGSATPGFFKWAIAAINHFQLIIYSSRSKTPEGITAMREAIGKWSVDAVHNGEIGGDYDWGELFSQIEFSDVKPPAFLTIDDRAVCFNGDWAALDPAQLTEFRPWTMFNQSDENQFVTEWNHMVGTVSNFASKYNMPKPQMVFHPEWLYRMRSVSHTPLMPVIIYMGIKIQFGTFEQVDALRIA